MTNSTRLFGLFMTVMLWAGIAAAQGLPPANSGDDLPPDLTLPSQGVESLPTPAGQGTDAPVTAPSDAAQSDVSKDGMYEGESSDPYRPDLRGMWTELAPIESTGTWLRRGFWYAETDAVIYNRSWSRRDQRFAADDPHIAIGPNTNDNGLATTNGIDARFLNTNRILIVNSSLPGEDAAVRGTLGNFLFRDDHNRDHTLEFTAIGGGKWEQDRQMSSLLPNGLFVPFGIAGDSTAFDKSTRQTIVYDSNLASFEMNYHVRGRLGHDQLVMDPNGCWHRAADAGFEREFLAGLRFLQLGENLDWRAQDIVTTGADGSYLIHTENNLFGFQMGTGMTYQAPRWSVGLTGKGGVYVNDAVGTSQFALTASPTADANLRMREDQLSFVGEFKLQGRYHILPDFSLRAGYELLFITSAALAPNQATFTTDTSYLNATGNPLYHGASFGCEMYW